MSGSSYVQRAITLIFTLGTGTFGAAGHNQITISGLRVSCDIVKGGEVGIGQANVRVRGMTLSQMNQISTLGLLQTEVRKNSIQIMAGDAANGMSLVFDGTIINAWVDHQADPDTVFNVVASPGLYAAVAPASSSSFQGATSIVQIMSGLASQMGFKFENSGASGILANPYFPGTLRDQAERAAKAANINCVIDNGTVAIWPKGGARNSTNTPLISPQTGMVGYPTYTSAGLALVTLFNPAVTIGGAIKVQSSLQPACGVWNVQTLNYNLESEMPNGQWFMSMAVARPGYNAVSTTTSGS